MSNLENTLLQCLHHLVRQHPELSGKVGTLLRSNQSPLLQKYLEQKSRFSALGGTITHDYPILSDFTSPAGDAKGHYFHQDLLVASRIFQNRPQRHIDIGSRVDGFIAHVASFRLVECIDIRNLQLSVHKNIRFLRADLMQRSDALQEISDSISCLHAIEHFGLGRYGDEIDPDGHFKGFGNLTRMLKRGGVLYISFPIGENNEVHFNAHRVFHPCDIFTWPSSDSLSLEQFDCVDDAGNLHLAIDLTKKIPKLVHGCGIYTFRKL